MRIGQRRNSTSKVLLKLAKWHWIRENSPWIEWNSLRKI